MPTNHSRPPIKPVVDAVKTVLEAIDFDGSTYQAGIGGAPPCDPPYLIISLPTGAGADTEGPMDYPEADVEHRIQINAVAAYPEAALAMRDKASSAMTTPNVDNYLSTRRVQSVRLDLSQGIRREDGGRPAPLYTVSDQYEIKTTPGT
jgi:hypothetical protein